MVVFSIGPLYGLMIVTVEVYLFGLSLGIPRVSPLESPNPGAELPDMLLGAPLGLCFGYEAVRYMCSFLRLMDFHESTYWGGGISWVPPYGDFITSKLNSVRYC